MEPLLSPDRAERVESVFDQAVELEAGSRSAFLDGACKDDPGLRSEVESLLVAFDAHAASVRNLFEQLPLARPKGRLTGSSGDGSQTLGLTGQRVGRYRILQKLGGGGMGVVYQAYDARLDRTVALKFLPPHLHADEAASLDFKRGHTGASGIGRGRCPNSTTSKSGSPTARARR